MKKILLSLSIMLASFLSFGQDIESEIERINRVFDSYGCKVENGTVSIQNIVEVSGMNVQQLYSSVKNFVVSTYNSPNTVIQVDDPVNGHLVVKGVSGSSTCGCSDIVFTGSGMEYRTTHILKFDVKEGRVRITVTATTVQQKAGADLSTLRYTDYPVTKLYPVSNDIDVFTNNHYMNWYPKEGSKKQLQGFVHEGRVMLGILGDMSNLMKAAESSLLSVSQKDEDNW